MVKFKSLAALLTIIVPLAVFARRRSYVDEKRINVLLNQNERIRITNDYQHVCKDVICDVFPNLCQPRYIDLCTSRIVQSRRKLTSQLTDKKRKDLPNNIESNAKIYITDLDKQMNKMKQKTSLAAWNYATNITRANAQEQSKVSLVFQTFVKKMWLQTIRFPWQHFTNETLKREFKFYSQMGTSILPASDYKNLRDTINKMQSIYATAKVKPFNKKNKTGIIQKISLEPELKTIFANSNNTKELKFYWAGWSHSSGRKCKTLYENYVKLVNKAAHMNNYTSTKEMWLRDYETPNFDAVVDNIWTQVKPLYEELHAYVRYNLQKHYGKAFNRSTHGTIPAHLLGNLWSQEWTAIYKLSTPFPSKESLDFTKQMKDKGYTVHKMFKVAETFFKSLNFSALPKSFWTKSVFVKPKDREVQCHASAWDMSTGNDFRIKMCTSVNSVDFTTVHHEMGHVQYYLEYKKLPKVFRGGANPGFHEAVGDTIALSVETPKHLKKIGLLSKDYVFDSKNEINFLYMTALKKVAFLPYGLLLDKWRWDVFDGKTRNSQYNCDWWKKIWKYQGLEPPLHRNRNDFDAGAKYHIVADVSYIRYFVSVILQFQFYRALCIKSGQFNPNNSTEHPLYNCDIYESKEAGDAFRKMLQMGSSKPWPDALETLTGERNLNASALLDYFEPLHKWLKTQNSKNGVKVGWESQPKLKNIVTNCK